MWNFAQNRTEQCPTRAGSRNTTYNMSYSQCEAGVQTHIRSAFKNWNKRSWMRKVHFFGSKTNPQMKEGARYIIIHWYRIHCSRAERQKHKKGKVSQHWTCVPWGHYSEWRPITTGHAAAHILLLDTPDISEHVFELSKCHSAALIPKGPVICKRPVQILSSGDRGSSRIQSSESWKPEHTFQMKLSGLFIIDQNRSGGRKRRNRTNNVFWKIQ